MLYYNLKFQLFSKILVFVFFFYLSFVVLDRFFSFLPYRIKVGRFDFAKREICHSLKMHHRGKIIGFVFDKDFPIFLLFWGLEICLKTFNFGDCQKQITGRKI